MPGTTTNGYPTPLDSDAIATLAATARSLAGSLETLTNYRCKAYQSVVQSLANNTPVTVTFDSEAVDPQNMHSNTVNPSRITVPLSGHYTVLAQVCFASSVTGGRFVAINVNGVAQAQMMVGNFGSAVAMRVQCGAELVMNAGDYIEVVAQQVSGGALNTVQGQTLTFVDVNRRGVI